MHTKKKKKKTLLKTGVNMSVKNIKLLFLECFPGGIAVKNPPANAGDARYTASILGSGRSPGEGNGTPLQYSCLEKSMGRRAWKVTVHGATKSQTQLSD